MAPCWPCTTQATCLNSLNAHSDPIAHLQVYRKIHACALELLAKLGHSYVISTLSREPLFSISEDREVVCKEGAPQIPAVLEIVLDNEKSFALI